MIFEEFKTITENFAFVHEVEGIFMTDKTNFYFHAEYTLTEGEEKGNPFFSELCLVYNTNDGLFTVFVKHHAGHATFSCFLYMGETLVNALHQFRTAYRLRIVQ